MEEITNVSGIYKNHLTRAKNLIIPPHRSKTLYAVKLLTIMISFHSNSIDTENSFGSD